MFLHFIFPVKGLFLEGFFLMQIEGLRIVGIVAVRILKPFEVN